MAWKDFFEHFFPVTYHKLDCENKKILDELHNTTSIILQLREELQGLKFQISEVQREYGKQNERVIHSFEEDNQAFKQVFNQKISASTAEIQSYMEKQFVRLERTDAAINQSVEELEKKMSDWIEDNYRLIKISKENIDVIKRRQLNIGRTADEAVWAQIFNDTITDSKWLVDKMFSPGRWALGYPALYVLYRTLNEFQPQSILELGLGQSTKMTTQYIKTDSRRVHYVVENDLDWIAFYRHGEKLPESTSLVQLDTELVSFEESEAVRVYKNFSKNFASLKFDLIIIDAPWSGDMTKYARIDVLSILPGCLNSSFVIIFDDVQRSPEAATVQAIKKILNDSDIQYQAGVYRGAKDTQIITSIDKGFLCTM
ncbi:MAG: hypothetical protein LUE65_00630 [Clostridiales bacterium]|nr:hypothetical protein [Clostridiales bacterium]